MIADKLVTIRKENTFEYGWALFIPWHDFPQRNKYYNAVGVSEIVKQITFSKTVTLMLAEPCLSRKISQKRVWNLSDIVVCGRFDLKKRNVYLQFRGSTNQRVIRRKGKYKHYQIQDGETATILTINSDGNFNIKGFYTEDIAALSKMVKNGLN